MAMVDMATLAAMAATEVAVILFLQQVEMVATAETHMAEQ